jgi:outer membrane protein assembly factor BamA
MIATRYVFRHAIRPVAAIALVCAIVVAAERALAQPPVSESYWGPMPVASDSTTVTYQNRSKPAWEKSLLAPYYVLKVPFSLLNAGARETVTFLDESGAIHTIADLLGPREGPFGLVFNLSSGSLEGLGVGVTTYHDAFLSPRNRLRLGLRTSTNGHHRATAGLTIPVGDDGREFELGAGYRMHPNSRFFGIGPDSDEDDKSFVRQELTWFGANYALPLAGDLDFEAGALYSMVGARGPRDDDTPRLDDEFAGRIPPGYGERSDGVTTSLALVHDNTTESARPERGGVRTLKGGYFTSTDASDVEFWNYRVELQQFVPLWHSKRALALRSFVTWLESTGGDEVPFQRLMTNDDPDLLRGYNDFRWTDRGMVLASAEYRWPIWNAQTVDGPGLDMYFLVDIGQVFGEAEQISTRNMTDSEGIGLRLIDRNGFRTRLEFAWSNEESVIRLRADQVFQFAKNGLYHGRNPIPVR